MARDLGEDLESEILVRLPAKSLMRFKCVQRSWNALFRNHRFVMSHMNMHMSKEHLMVFKFNRNIHASLTCHDPSQPPRYLKCSSHNKSFDFQRSHGSCNGVFCVGGFDKQCSSHGFWDYRLILWNPNTRESKLIPFPSNKSSCEFQGFGVDPNTNDFKIIKPIINFDDLRDPIISYAEVYNLSTNSWTVIHDVTLPPINNVLEEHDYYCNVLVKGVYHWLIGHEDGFGYILCFDFCNNQFSKLMAPIYLSNSESLLVKDNIVEINGSIGYIVRYDEQEQLEIWVMNQHKWTKTHSLVWPKDIFIFGVWKDGNQLLGVKDGNKQRLTIYNLDAQPVHQFPAEVFYYCQIDKYVESIVPLSA